MQFNPDGDKYISTLISETKPIIKRESVSCDNCMYYKLHKSSYGDLESCKHPENTHFTYDHRGKHSHIIWEPQNKNKALNCEFWEQKKTIMQKIKLKLGFM